MLGMIIEKQKRYKKISAVLPLDLADFLSKKAKNQHVSMSKILKRALEDYFIGEF
jgi:hypothetical protein